MPTRPLHDPRTMVTPDAFEVSPELLGMPLARPGKRLVAFLIDVVIVGAISLLTSSFALLLGVAASVFFIRAGLQRTEVRGSVFNRMSVLPSWWNGQTVGKKVMGLRVVRLDGEPITWWVAFERTGGYAAGFATGLLGFTQIYWDANRQAIHDHIVGTVVLDTAAATVPDRRQAL